MLKKTRHVSLIKTLRYNIFQLCLTLMSTAVCPSAWYTSSYQRKKNFSVQKSWWWKQQYLLLVEGLAVWRLSRNQFKPVWAETIKNYPAWKLELLSSQNRYIGHQCGIWQIMGEAIFFVKWSLLIKVLVKALDAVEDGRKSPFFKYLSIIFFYGKT